MLNCPKDDWDACVEFILGPEFADNWKVLELPELKALQAMEVHERPTFDLSQLEQWADFTVEQQRINDDDDDDEEDEEEEEEEDDQVAAEVEPPEDEDDPNQPDPPTDESSAESD
jgi:hypothetical protein